VQLCLPLEAPDERVVIGSWETRAAWEAWNESDAFQSTRKRMDRCEVDPKGEWWHEVVLAERR
jgi:heme-degrading monooxygenase HmoA